MRSSRVFAVAGFTLIELAVTLFILTLILGSLLGPLSAQVEQRKISETQQTLDQVKEALVGSAVTLGHIPCPDKTTAAGVGILPNLPNDGLEDITAAGTCVVQEGNVPWANISVGSTDAWGNRLRYRVTPAFAQRAPAALFTLANVGTLTVICQPPTCSPAVTEALNTAAVIISHGNNGWGAISSTTGNAKIAPTSGDELGNTDNNTTFVLRAPGTAGSPNGEFDDLVTWISTSILFNRMVAAQKLP